VGDGVFAEQKDSVFNFVSNERRTISWVNRLALGLKVILLIIQLTADLYEPMGNSQIGVHPNFSFTFFKMSVRLIVSDRVFI
jgi:hypothetical protein